MVGHEYPGVNGHLELLGGLSQPVRVRREILVPSKTRLAVVAALDQVLGHTRGTYTIPSCHGSSLTLPERSAGTLPFGPANVTPCLGLLL
jgi:hypothetical protein